MHHPVPLVTTIAAAVALALVLGFIAARLRLPALVGPTAAPAGSLWLALGKTLLAVAGFVALMLVVGRRLFPWILWQRAWPRSASSRSSWRAWACR